jgi:hypothetical protein
MRVASGVEANDGVVASIYPYKESNTIPPPQTIGPLTTATPMATTAKHLCMTLHYVPTMTSFEHDSRPNADNTTEVAGAWPAWATGSFRCGPSRPEVTVGASGPPASGLILVKLSRSWKACCCPMAGPLRRRAPRLQEPHGHGVLVHVGRGQGRPHQLRAHRRPAPPSNESCAQGTSVAPKTRKVVVFYSMLPSGEGDPMSLHAGCPVEEGVKLSGNKWVWNKPRREDD